MQSSVPDPMYDRLEERLAAWAAAREDVRAVVIIGSRARTDHPADACSDLDTITFVDDSEPYTHDLAWKRALEAALELPTWFAAFSYTGRNDPEWEFVLAGGYKVDTVFSQNRSLKGCEAGLDDMLEFFPYRYVFEHGMRVLVDKGPTPRSLDIPTPSRPELPNQAEFTNRIASYLLELTTAVKLAGRGELWRAARAINEDLQSHILAILEWQAQANHGLDYKTWHYGRFLEEWADPRAVAALPGTYADCTLPGLRKAILAGLDLLDWLGPETAKALEMEYPGTAVELSGKWLRENI